MAELILGPMLRYVGTTEATVWVETDVGCEVEILGHRTRTFGIYGHHYALLQVAGLTPRSTYPYQVRLDGQPVWPSDDSADTTSTIRTLDPATTLKVAFGSCHVAAPHVPPYTDTRASHPQGRGRDALHVLAERMHGQAADSWPDILLMLGDQIYADDAPPATAAFIRSRRNVDQPPGEEAADFEEYARLYRDSWRDPAIRWLLANVPSVMIFDDHDMLDDWNISAQWVQDMRAQAWWNDKIVSGFMTYWIYQHLGNLSPRQLADDDLYRRIRAAEDAGSILETFAFEADRKPLGCRWSVYRDFGSIRLIVMDSRAARVLETGDRAMIDNPEWEWIDSCTHGDFNHLLLATSLPFVTAPAIHYLESWNEAVCAGAWGQRFAVWAEQLRRRLDLEHWSAFQASFQQLTRLIRAVASGRQGRPPRSIVILSGDVHHGYLAGLTFPGPTAVQSAIYQIVCSPFRNALDNNERRIVRLGWRPWLGWVAKWLARAAGRHKAGVDWRLMHEQPWFDNQVGTLYLTADQAQFKLETIAAGSDRLEAVFAHTLD